MDNELKRNISEMNSQFLKHSEALSQIFAGEWFREASAFDVLKKALSEVTAIQNILYKFEGIAPYRDREWLMGWEKDRCWLRNGENKRGTAQEADEIGNPFIEEVGRCRDYLKGALRAMCDPAPSQHDDQKEHRDEEVTKAGARAAVLFSGILSPSECRLLRVTDQEKQYLLNLADRIEVGLREMVRVSELDLCSGDSEQRQRTPLLRRDIQAIAEGVEGLVLDCCTLHDLINYCYRDPRYDNEELYKLIKSTISSAMATRLMEFRDFLSGLPDLLRRNPELAPYATDRIVAALRRIREGHSWNR